MLLNKSQTLGKLNHWTLGRKESITDSGFQRHKGASFGQTQYSICFRSILHTFLWSHAVQLLSTAELHCDDYITF